MRAIERTRTGATRDANRTSVTRLPELPPPSAASMRAVARHRGAFAESLPTLRLPKVGLAAVAQAQSIEAAVTLEVVLESDGVPIAIPPRITMELDSCDVAIADDADDVLELDADDVVESTPDCAIAADEGEQDRCVESVVPPGGWFAELVASRYDEDAERWADELDPPQVEAGHDECRVAPAIAVCEHAADVVLVGDTVRAPSPIPMREAVAAPTRARAWWMAGVAALAGALGYIAALEVHVVPRHASPVLAGLARVPDRRDVAPAPPVAATQAPIAPTPTIAAPTIVPTPAPVAATPAPIAATPAASPPVATTPPAITPTIRRAAKPVRRRASEADDADTVDEAVAAPAPVVASSPSAPPNADMLMREALRAFSQSRWATAFHYTERARALGANVAASRLAAISACHLRRVAKAEVAYRELPLGQRAGVRNKCQAAGVVLPEPGA